MFYHDFFLGLSLSRKQDLQTYIKSGSGFTGLTNGLTNGLTTPGGGLTAARTK